MDEGYVFKGSFDSDAGVKGAALTDAGSIWWEDGCLHLQGRLSRPVARKIAGVFGLLAGLAAVVAVTVILEDHDIDLMRYRKGPVFVGFMAIVAMGIGFGRAAWLADLLLGKRVHWTIPIAHLESRIWSQRVMDFSWDIDPPNAARFYVGRREADKLAELAHVLNEARKAAVGAQPHSSE